MTASFVSPRLRFAHQLEDVRDGVLTMASMVEKAIDHALDALRRRDLALAERIIREDRFINRQRFDIEQSALLLLATQQPMASDLRFLAAVLYITTDLERMGDHARGVARLCVKLSPEAPLAVPPELGRMGELCRERLRGALDAFVARDVDAAREIAARDRETDALQDSIYRQLLETMAADPGSIARATYLIWVAHNVERIGDHITNICERVIYAVTGTLEELTETSDAPAEPAAAPEVG